MSTTSTAGTTSTAPARDEIPDVPGERLTKALVRLADHRSGKRFAIVTLDNGEDHTKPSTLGPGGLKALDAALDAAEASDADAIVVTGKPFWFIAGFDLTTIGSAGGRDDRAGALRLARYGHHVLGRLGTGPKPTFALVGGAALGGGLELALHCRYRTVSTGVTAVALPECFLGLLPGWGGTYLLPNLIGADRAVQVIIDNALNQNRMLTGRQVHELGIADVAIAPADFLERSLDWAVGVLTGAVTVDRPEPDRGEAWAAAVARGRALADARVRGAAPAPYRALDLVALARTASRAEAFEAESQAVADLAVSQELRAGLYAFDLVQKRAKRPAGAPDPSLAREVTKVGIVGAGLMASQLALLHVRRLEVPVVLTDVDQQRIDKGVGFVHAEIDKLLQKGRLGPDKANRLRRLVTGSLDKSAFADCDFVIEAVFEDLGVKRQVLGELESYVKPECVLATNTSSLSVSAMAEGLAHPDRVVGFHFFNPVAVMPLLEIARGERTDDSTLATAFAVGKKLGKTCIAVKDAPAFVANRLFMRFFNEVTRAIDEGADFDVAEHALDPLGLPMTPLQLLTFTGPAVSYHVMRTLHDALPDRFYVSDNLGRVVESGVTSFFGPDGALDPRVRGLYRQGPVTVSGEEILRRAVEAMADEIARLLDEGVVAEPADVDLALITGGGYPFHLGGITPYLDRTGVSERVTGRRFAPPGVATLP
ncbi:MAG: 3-hydroxyacyl-CoA dehydrogenase NAD-binding domain-containing protein [Frankiaceae bacterium]